MTHDDLAAQAVDLLGRLLSGSLAGPTKIAADKLYDLASGRLSRKRESAAIEEFQGNPTMLASRARLQQKLAAEMHLDPDFLDQVKTYVKHAQYSSSVHLSQKSGRDSFGAGRDLSVDQSRKKTKVNFGGILVAVVAVVALIFGTKVVIDKTQGSESEKLDANSTCTEFLQADTQTQIASMKAIYLTAGKAEKAGDPFILQNATYSCGQSPGMKLGSLAK